MIVKKPIGSVKILNRVFRLTVGKSVPKNILEHWERTGQIEGLKKAGAISDEKESKQGNSKSSFGVKEEKKYPAKEEKHK